MFFVCHEIVQCHDHHEVEEVLRGWQIKLLLEADITSSFIMSDNTDIVSVTTDNEVEVVLPKH